MAHAQFMDIDYPLDPSNGDNFWLVSRLPSRGLALVLLEDLLFSTVEEASKFLRTSPAAVQSLMLRCPMSWLFSSYGTLKDDEKSRIPDYLAPGKVECVYDEVVTSGRFVVVRSKDIWATYSEDQLARDGILGEHQHTNGHSVDLLLHKGYRDAQHITLQSRGDAGESTVTTFAPLPLEAFFALRDKAATLEAIRSGRAG